MEINNNNKNVPAVLGNIQVCLSPALFDQFRESLDGSIVVVIDVLRATTTIATALKNGATGVKAVYEVSECIETAKQLSAIAGGERDGKVAPGLEHGNSPLEYTESLISGQQLVLTTTNGTKLLTMAQRYNPSQIITGSFVNLQAVVNHIELSVSNSSKPTNIILACAGWRDSVCLEDSLFAGAVVSLLRATNSFQIQCDSALMTETLYNSAKTDIYGYLQSASHFKRLEKLFLYEDLRYCLTPSTCDVVPILTDGFLVSSKPLILL